MHEKPCIYIEDDRCSWECVVCWLAVNVRVGETQVLRNWCENSTVGERQLPPASVQKPALSLPFTTYPILTHEGPFRVHSTPINLNCLSLHLPRQKCHHPKCHLPKRRFSKAEPVSPDALTPSFPSISAPHWETRGHVMYWFQQATWVGKETPQGLMRNKPFNSTWTTLWEELPWRRQEILHDGY